MASSLLFVRVLTLLAISAQPQGSATPLQQAKVAAAEGRLFVPGGALDIVGSAQPQTDELLQYKEALEELRSGEMRFRYIYTTTDGTGTAELLAHLKASKKLENQPELLAHVYRLQRWQADLEALRKAASEALSRGDLAQAMLLYEQAQVQPLAQTALTPKLKEEIEFAAAAYNTARATYAAGMTDAWLKGFSEVRAAAAAGRMWTDTGKDGKPVDGASELLQKTLTATMPTPGNAPARLILGRYQDALAEIRRQENLIKLAYGAHQSIAEMLTTLRGSSKLKDFPELIAYVYHLEKWSTDYNALRAKVKAAVDSRNFEEAKKLYAEMEPLAQGVPTLIEEIASGRAMIEEQDHLILSLWHWLKEVVAPFKTPVLVLLGVIVLLLLVSLLLQCKAWIQRLFLKRREDSELVIYDLSDEARPGASELQMARLKVCFQEVALQPTVPVTGHEANLGEALPQWDSTAYESLKDFAQYLGDEQKVTVGPLSVPAKALWNILAQLAFKQRRYQLTGVVSVEGGNIRVFIRKFDNATGKEIGRWTAIATGITAAATNDAFRQLALKLAHQKFPADKQMTKSPDAFAAYYQALLVMDGVLPQDDRAQALKKARDLLQAALAHDPRMAHAKLKLAIVMRKLREPEVARALLEELPEGQLSDEKKYHSALLQAQGRWLAALRGAHKVFKELAAHEGRLALDAKACLLEVCGKMRTGKSTRHQLTAEESADLDAQIRELEAFFEKSTPPKGVTEKEFAPVRGYALYVMGRRRLDQAELMEFSSEQLQEARSKLENELPSLSPEKLDSRSREALQRVVRKDSEALMQRALTYLPDLIAAHTCLARVYRQANWPRWEEYAERALKRASQINPDDPLVNEEYGFYFASREPTDHDQAADYFKKAAERRPSSRFEWGKILARKNEPMVGIERMWEAIRMFDGNVQPSYLGDLVQCTLQAGLALRKAAESGVAGGQPSLTSVEDPAKALLEQAREAQNWLAIREEKLKKDNETRQSPTVAKLIEDYARVRQEVTERIQQVAPWPSPHA
ncbi:tetratricopeptide repeat protein [Hyalangium gracile]|uniref:tetratricopeptide repeat protein n=1 Tax=Hyalangium gracile TaxID=394092 RepID=UPI001CCC5D37|nr:tetratricopeptide repeat protein [Hyalangium gracile]